MPAYRELKPEDLAWRLDENRLKFKTTNDLEGPVGTVGQERAQSALDFGLSIKSFGYNLFVMGQTGTGRMSTVQRVLEKKSLEGPGPSDWLYVMDFEKPDRPKIVNLPRGKGCELEVDMDNLIEQLKKAVPKAFEGEEFENRRENLLSEHNARTTELFEGLEMTAKERGFSLEKSPRGLVLVPIKENGSLMSQEEFELQDPAVKQDIEERGSVLQNQLGEAMRKVRDLEKMLQEKIKNLNREVGIYAAGHFIDELVEKYKEFPQLRNYFEEVREDILENIEDFKGQAQPAQMPFMQRQEPSFDKYKVNLLVNNCTAGGAPVIYESNPTFPNLFGRIEQKMQYGMATTDFTMIKAGALHRANGGYLVLDALDLLKNPFSYDGIKRAIKNKAVTVEDALEQYRMVPIHTLKPEPVPLDVKVVLVGPPMVYYLLYNYDEEFKKLFKVHADFDSRMNRTEDTIDLYATFIAARSKEEGLLPFDRSGVARVVEYAARLVDDKDKLSLKFMDVLDLIRESSFWATKAGALTVSRDHVNKAMEEEVYRSSMLEERIRQAIDEGVIMVDTSGEVPGQVNGLSVITLGGYSFGRPNRITARTYMGRAGMVHVEREVKMSGPIHDKGVLILQGFLGERFASDKPLALSASITFEQSYEGIEGDSASSTELYALLSSLSGLPIKQGIAVTGSVNQRGQVQAIGGVNEKIEGYFQVCKTLGLTGEQGVLIPDSNVKNLMLKDEVIDAVRDGKFHIWSVRTVDAGIELLTGTPAGERMPDGRFQEGTVNFFVDKKLRNLAEGMKEFAAKTEEKPQEEKKAA